MRPDRFYALIARVLIIVFSLSVIVSMAHAQNNFRERGLVQGMNGPGGDIYWDNSVLIIVDKAENSSGSNHKRRHFDVRETEQVMDVITYQAGRVVEHIRYLVSTGSEKRVCPPEGDCHISTTPVGFYNINSNRRHQKYKSKTWKAWMAYAQFFHQGWAIHGIYTDKQHLNLGTRASGGCIRMSYQASEELYNYIDRVGVQNVGLFIYDSSSNSLEEKQGKIEAETWLRTRGISPNDLYYRN